MAPTLDDLYAAFESYRGYDLNEQQKEAVESNSAATWILAGPGTGKTETLVVRVLRLILVDEVSPESILFTTFTNRAATNLEDRLSLYLDGILDQPNFPDVDRPNISSIWIGTLHHLAHDILNQMEENTREITLLDQEASLFRLLRELTTGTIQNERLYEAITGEEVPPYRRYDRIHFAEKLKAGIDRTVEDNVDIDKLEAADSRDGHVGLWPNDGSKEDFISALEEYEESLDTTVDFSRLQRQFLDFLQSSRSSTFLSGSDDQQFSGINHVIVDEYQDTNPIQERIYLELANDVDSFTVVGDDDQALYRFRGASVDAMVMFDERVKKHQAGNDQKDVDTIKLQNNYRSRDGLVDSLNRYIETVGEIGRYGEARTQKGRLETAANVSGNFPPVQLMVGESESDLAKGMIESVKTLRNRSIIQDPRQIALLAHSTRVTSRSAFQPYQQAFEDERISLFNPGAKNLHHDENLKAVFGIMSLILDPRDHIISVEGKEIKEYVGYGDDTREDSLRAIGKEYLERNSSLRERVEKVAERFNQQGWKDTSDYPTNWNFLDVFYTILNQEPFSNFLDESGGPQKAIEAWRLGWLSSVIESFQQNLGMNGRLFPAEDDFYTRRFYEIREQDVPKTICGINPFIVDSFYRDLLGVFKRGGFDEIEGEVESLPPQHHPALTVHQSKGLQFPIVFAVANQPFKGPSSEHHQEDLFSPYRQEKARDIEQFSQKERAIHDEIRRFFVEISRAESLCVIAIKEEVYKGLIEGEKEICERYPYLPSDWVKSLPVHHVNNESD